MKETRKAPSLKNKTVKNRDNSRKKQPASQSKAVSRVSAQQQLKNAVKIGPVDTRKKEVRDRLRESHKHIQETIVTGPPPPHEIDIISDIVVSKMALDKYVTLDWQHFE